MLKAMTDQTRTVLHVAADGKLHFINTSHNVSSQNCDRERQHTLTLKSDKRIYVRMFIKSASLFSFALHMPLDYVRHTCSFYADLDKHRLNISVKV